MRHAATLLALVLLAGCARIEVSEQSVFFPARKIAVPDFARAGVTAEDLWFTAGDATRLNAWYLRQPGARATVLFFGGNAFYLAESRSFADAILAHGVSLFMMDYRAYGRSEGTPSAASLKSDALRAYDTLRERFERDPRRIIVHGHSLGTFAAAYVASERPAGALVLQNPATNGRETLRRALPWFAKPFVRLEVAPALLADDNLERVRRVSIPTLVAGGSKDRITSPEMAREIFAASPARSKRLVIVKGGGHNDLLADPGFEAAYGELVASVAAAAGGR